MLTGGTVEVGAGVVEVGAGVVEGICRHTHRHAQMCLGAQQRGSTKSEVWQ